MDNLGYPQLHNAYANLKYFATSVKQHGSLSRLVKTEKIVLLDIVYVMGMKCIKYTKGDRYPELSRRLSGY